MSIAATAALLTTAVHAFADPPVTMAPPVGSYGSQAEDGQPVDAVSASQDTVFNWKEVPADQNVPIRRAVFDQGGYQLYDAAGETIVVPFSNNNLYAMKFGLSNDGTTYFVNEGDAPVLYVPHNGYLENAGVPGARWFPFPEDFRPERPVFLGIAPSWEDYRAMGWYPDMAFYGGYWGERPYFAGSVFTASFGLSIFIGGHHYDGWEPYHHYYAYHPAPYHVTIVNRNVYRFGGGFGGRNVYFRGAGYPYSVDRGFSGGRRPSGSSRLGGAHDFEGVHRSDSGRNFGGDRIFNGTGRPYYAHHASPGSRDFNGIRATAPVGGRAFGGARPLSGEHSFGGGHTFSGGRSGSAGSFGPSPAGGGRVFGGGHSEGPRPASHDGHSFGGAHPNISRGNGSTSSNHSDDHSGNHGHDHGGRR